MLESTRRIAQVRHFEDQVREAGLRWFGHMQRRDIEYSGKRTLKKELPGKRKRKRPNMIFIDVVIEVIQIV